MIRPMAFALRDANPTALDQTVANARFQDYDRTPRRRR
jgi:hypothetical protein